jgi:hypothetical protein
MQIMRKKRAGGKHKTPRTAVQLQTDWIQVARRLAAKRKQPTAWFLVSLIAEAAAAEGEASLPPMPWEAE